MTCPRCHHLVKRHVVSFVSFNKALKPDGIDYDAMSCHHGECGCCIELQEWARLIDEPRQEGLPL